MLVVPDLENIAPPLPDEMLVNLSESKEIVKQLLIKLPIMFSGSQQVGCAFGPALQAAYQVVVTIISWVFQFLLETHRWQSNCFPFWPSVTWRGNTLKERRPQIIGWR